MRPAESRAEGIDLTLLPPRCGDTLSTHTHAAQHPRCYTWSAPAGHDLMSTLCAGSRLRYSRRRLRQCYRVFRRIGSILAHFSPGSRLNLEIAEVSVMALRTILEFPDQRCAPGRSRDPVRPLSSESSSTTCSRPCMQPRYRTRGHQVDVHKRLLVIDVSEGRNEPLVFINPRSCCAKGWPRTRRDACPWPGIFDEVKRAAKVRVRSQDRTGAVVERDFEGVLRVCVQHERIISRVAVRRLPVRPEAAANRKKLEKERKHRATAMRHRHPLGPHVLSRQT